MGKRKKVARIPLWAFLISIPVAIAGISRASVAYLQFLESRGPCLRTVVDCEHWNDPCDVEEELNGMVKISHLCKSLEKVMEVMDPNIMAKIRDVCDLSCDIIIEVNEISPCEADIVALLKSMHTIKMRNDGSDSIVNLGIIFERAEYIEYQKEGEERQRIRGQKQKIIPLGDLSPEGTIEMSAWATCKVSKQPEFIIRHKQRRQDIYIRTPVGECAALVNKYPVAIWTLLLFVCLFCSFAGWVFRTLVHPTPSKHGRTPPVVPTQEQENKKGEAT